MRGARLLLTATILNLVGAHVAPAEDVAKDANKDTTVRERPTVVDPTILLLRDDVVRSELDCTDEQNSALNELLRKHNRILLAIRDVGPTGADETARPALLEIRDQFAKILSNQQRERLQGLILQAQGYDALQRKDIAAKLRLSAEQQQQLARSSEGFRESAGALQQPGRASSPERLQEDLLKLQTARKDRILAILTPAQTKSYGAMLGAPFDLSKVKPSPALAPEFEAIEAWLNSEPITMESLRGQVVVIHFFAFGCINCIHNYPWYKEWYADLHGKGVSLIGIHTPETQSETDNDLLRASLKENDLKFPVAVDKEKKMWQAWYNGIWPSVYIIDKQGHLRYWWYGELDWEGAGNQKTARRQIEQLMAEPAPTPATNLAG